MRPITISLDAETFKLAKKKTNFSAWIRDQLRSERNKMEKPWKWCYACDRSMQTNNNCCVNKNCKEFLVAILEDLQ